MCERLYSKIKDIECESNLYISNNKVLFETIFNLINGGVPVPSAYYINEKLIDKETKRYVLTKYIYDVDGIIYKVEAHTKMQLERAIKLRERIIEANYLRDGEVEDSYAEDKYNALDSLQIYVSHPNFENIWNDSTMTYFINCYHDEHNYKILTHILEKEELGYDLQIELFEIPQNPVQSFLVANHLSKIREALQCGPLMHFLFTKTNIPEDAFDKMRIRQNEIIYILKKSDYLVVVISIHYDDEFDKYIALGLCKNIHFTTKTMDLSGNLDCTFYADFPSHIITSEHFSYDKNIDKDNYTKEKRCSFKRLHWKKGAKKSDKHERKNNQSDFSKREEEKQLQQHDTNMTEHLTENVTEQQKKDTHYENVRFGDPITDNSSSSSSTSSSTSSSCGSSSGSDEYERETVMQGSNDASENMQNSNCDAPTGEEDEGDKAPNVGFMALKMDIKLFNGCKDFSELIQIASRTSNIIVSFRDFLNNALILYRINQRRTF